MPILFVYLLTPVAAVMPPRRARGSPQVPSGDSMSPVTMLAARQARQQELAIRMALGSGTQALVGLVLRQAASPVLLGTGAGLATALLLLRWVRALFYQATTAGPISLTGSVLLLLCAAAMAAIVPARRAASIDPMRALRID